MSAELQTSSVGKPADRVRGRGSLTLVRGLQLLRVMAAHAEGISVSRLASELGTHRAGIYRLLEPLIEDRIIARDADGLYFLDVGLIELARAVRPRLQSVAAPQLQQLADELGCTTALTVRDGEEGVLLSVFEPRNATTYVAHRPGLRHPLDRSAPGLAILAGQAPRPGERVEITRARERGWAVTSGEVIPAGTGVAAPLRTGDPQLQACIGAGFLDDRDVEAVAQALTGVASVISATLTGETTSRSSRQHRSTAGTRGGRP